MFAETGDDDPTDGGSLDDYLSDAEQRGRKPYREFIDAENFDRRGVRPINQRRLFEVEFEVVARGYIVARHDHLASDFSIASFVRLPERGCTGAGDGR